MSNYDPLRELTNDDELVVNLSDKFEEGKIIPEQLYNGIIAGKITMGEYLRITNQK